MIGVRKVRQALREFKIRVKMAWWAFHHTGAVREWADRAWQDAADDADFHMKIDEIEAGEGV